MNTRRIPLPREHGAWAMLLAAVLVAWAHPWVRGWPAAVLTLLFVLSFAIQEPLRAVSTGQRDARAWIWLAAYGAALLGGAAWLVVSHQTYAIIPAAVAGALFTALDLVLRRRRRHRHFVLRLFGGAGLTLVLPAVLALYHPQQTGYAFVLWILTLAYFVTRLLAVRARNAAVRRDPAAPAWRRAVHRSQAGLYVLLIALAALRHASPWVFAAYLPGSLAALRLRTDLDLRALGWREVAHLAWFVIALLVSFHLPPQPIV